MPVVTLHVEVEGAPMDEAGAMKLAAKVQSAVAPLLKVPPEDLVVEVSVMDQGEEEAEGEGMTPAKFADQAAAKAAAGMED